MRDASRICSPRQGAAGDLFGGDARSIKAEQPSEPHRSV